MVFGDPLTSTTVTMSGNQHTYTGPTVINADHFRILGGTYLASLVELGLDTHMLVEWRSTSNEGGVQIRGLQGSGAASTITLETSLTINSGGHTTYNGTFSGRPTLTLAGPGSLTLTSANNNLSGNVRVSTG